MIKACLVYSSITGNTEKLADEIEASFKNIGINIEKYKIMEFNGKIEDYDIFIVGTYTWGDGEIPNEFNNFITNINSNKNIVTGIFGTGDSFYNKFCGAVDKFTEIFYNKTNLAVTLKVELYPDENDLNKCNTFVEKLLNRINQIK